MPRRDCLENKQIYLMLLGEKKGLEIKVLES